MTNLLLPLALAAIFAAASAQADKGYRACMENAATNTDFSACGSVMLERRDAELDRAWKKAIAGLDAATRAALLAEQRSWIAYKDKSCRYWTRGAFGREGQTVHFYTCREGVVDRRIEYLEEIGRGRAPETQGG